jgi:hypothetical protein
MTKDKTNDKIEGMKMSYKKAYGVLKTEGEMKYDYGMADYPYSKETYDYFVGLAVNNQPQSKTKTQSSTVDSYGRIKPADDIAALGQALRELFDKNKRR